MIDYPKIDCGIPAGCQGGGPGCPGCGGWNDQRFDFYGRPEKGHERSEILNEIFNTNIVPDVRHVDFIMEGGGPYPYEPENEQWWPIPGSALDRYLRMCRLSAYTGEPLPWAQISFGDDLERMWPGSTTRPELRSSTSLSRPDWRI